MTRFNWLDREDEFLAPYGMHARFSKGRRFPEPENSFRTLYQRDRDRIVHSTAFRRLMYKTQVMVNQTAGDHHRTRLTHTLEVAQISRTIARQMGLNEDLTEAIALLHDLGHPPFGHTGEDALQHCMKDHGGFEHNWHGLRIVEELEYRYPDFPGLNLSWEVLEAQAFHSKLKEAPEIKPFLSVGQPLLEAQVVDAADSLTYDTHDIDDALSVGLITMADLQEVPFWVLAFEKVKQDHPQIGPLQIQPTVVRALINWQVTDLLEQTQKNLQEFRIQSIQDIRTSREELVTPGPDVRSLKAELEKFLRERVYNHYRVKRMVHKGARILEQLFQEYRQHPDQLPNRYLDRTKKWPIERIVCDYIAGMTDRYAQEEFLRLFHPYGNV